MKKKEMIKKSQDFSDIIKTGMFLKNKDYSIYYKVKEEEAPKFGLAVSKHCGTAVERNKIKRRLRVIVDNYKNLFLPRNNYIIMVKKDIGNLSFKQMQESLVNLMSSRKGKNNEKN